VNFTLSQFSARHTHTGLLSSQMILKLIKLNAMLVAVARDFWHCHIKYVHVHNGLPLTSIHFMSSAHWPIWLTALPNLCADCLEILGASTPAALRACPGQSRDCFTSFTQTYLCFTSSSRHVTSNKGTSICCYGFTVNIHMQQDTQTDICTFFNICLPC
jgi:hypothetical protein